ncbi:MAG: Glycosyl hydrolases family 2, sugar binding domain [Lentisphaerae bacterium ADurb.Bin242]|nr:MAG: Glycosyl hydrolases family 2, sugar binding domain [Lentisphaerae bacterium ADurb.Bin242]
MKKRNITLFFAGLFFTAFAAGNATPKEELAKINSVLNAEKVLAESTHMVVRRAAWRFLLGDPASFEKSAINAMKDRDPAVREYAFFRYFEIHADKAFPQLEKMASDPDPEVRKKLLVWIVEMKDGKKVASLRQIAARTAGETSGGFPFYRETQRLKDNPTHDYEVIKLMSIPLPETGWDFTLDKADNGHINGFFKPDFDSSKWKKVKLIHWEKQGFPGYDGIAWYRIKFKMPPKMDSNAVELAFGAVDENAWVWLNGTYLGQQDLGPEGWEIAFWLDATREIKWGAENILAVRVKDTQFGGGIWKPVRIEILK